MENTSPALPPSTSRLRPHTASKLRVFTATPDTTANLGSPTGTHSKEIEWENLSWQEKSKKKHRWLLRFLTIKSELESFLYSLSVGLLTTAALVFVLTYFSPLTLVITTGLFVWGLSGWLFWSVWGTRANTWQNILLFLAAGLLAGFFILCMNLAAIPSLGVASALSGEGFLVACATVASYLVIGISITQLGITSFKHWKISHQLNSKNTLKAAHSLAKALQLAENTSTNQTFSFSEKLYLGYGAFASLAIGLIMGAIGYYSVTHLLPISLSILGLSLGSSFLFPIGITLLVLTSLILSKQVLVSFIKEVEERKNDRLTTQALSPPSLFEDLLNKNSAISFNQQPLTKTYLVLKAFCEATFSYKAYQDYEKIILAEKYHKKNILSPKEFRVRLVILVLFLPLTLIIFCSKPAAPKKYRLLLTQNLRGKLFWKTPVRFSNIVLRSTWNYLFSYRTYRKLCVDPRTTLSTGQFYLRNFMVLLLFPAFGTLTLLSLYASSIGLMQFAGLFKISENLALSISGMIDSVCTVIISPLLTIVLDRPKPTPGPTAAVTVTRITQDPRARRVSTATVTLGPTSRKPHSFTPPPKYSATSENSSLTIPLLNNAAK